MTPPALPELVDAAGIQREMKVKRAAAEAIMRELPKVTLPGLAKVFVRRADVVKLVDECTIDVVSAAARRRRAA